MSTLSILVESCPEIEIKGFNGGASDAVTKVGSKIVEVDTDIVKAGISRILTSLSDIIKDFKFSDSDYQVEELKINLNVGANGEVSILSMTGNANVSSSITVTIKKK